MNCRVLAVTVPSRVIVALTPLVVAMITGRSCSTARIRDIASCW